MGEVEAPLQRTNYIEHPSGQSEPFSSRQRPPSGKRKPKYRGQERKTKATISCSYKSI